MPPNNRDDNDWIFDPSLASMNRSLQREIRDEAEEVESIVAESELRARTFADVALEHRNKGEIVVVATTTRSFTGQIVYAAGDLISIKTDTIEADINVADVSYMRVVDRGRGAGQSGDDGPGTFEMRLVERRSPHERVEVGFCAQKETVIGTITTVGQDHAVIKDDHGYDWTTPVSAISYVVRQGRRAR